MISSVDKGCIREDGNWSCAVCVRFLAAVQYCAVSVVDECTRDIVVL